MAFPVIIPVNLLSSIGFRTTVGQMREPSWTETPIEMKGYGQDSQVERLSLSFYTES